MRSVFISYSRDDQTAAQLIAKYLSDAGQSVYFDYQGVVSGDSWSDQLGSALRKADAVVVLLSSNSRRSTYVKDELQTALESKKLVVPVLLDEGAKQNWLWPLVATRQAVNLDLQSGELDRQLQNLTRALSLLPDINVTSISPFQLSGRGEAGLYDVGRFQKTYLAQGDSWFSIGTIPPWSTTNLLQQMVLSRPTLVVNCARPGVQLPHMTDTSTAREFLNLLNANVAWKWDGLLMSGGGNDLIDAANSSPNASVDKRLLLKAAEWGNDAAPSRYLSDAGWATFAGHMREVLDLLLAQRDKKAINRDAPIFFHTYDYVTPRNAPAGLGNGPWLVKAMDAYGIPPADWNAVSDELMDRHAAMWLDFAEKLAGKNVHVVDSRGATTRAATGAQGESNDWENEFHPTANGYSLLAKKWRPQLDTLT